jgi:hypothetical protein
MPTTDHSTARQQPDIRPLGYIAVGFGVLALILAPTYFFSLYAYLAAAPALVVGLIARKDEPTKKTGNVAVALSLTAALVALAVLFST